MKPHENNSSHRILVIDDNASIHEDFQKILTKTKRMGDDLLDMESALFGSETQTMASSAFEIDCAFQGKEGLAMVQQAIADGRPYALAFVDGRMPPGWDGIETISRIWRECPDLQVVLCTAYSDYSWQEIQRVLGETDSLLILKKPFDNVEVLQFAHALTRKWELNREIQGRLNQLAFYDSLTGLPNRTQFIDRLSQNIESAHRHNYMGALLFIDLDNFKRINDTLGHSVGDELLKKTAQRLTKCLRASDTIAHAATINIAARLGGDEFTVVLTELKCKEAASVVARRISQTISQPMNLGKLQIIVTPSIGIALFPQDGNDVETLLKNADLAMYFAKRNGPDTFKYYQESMNAMALKRLTIENHLRKAFDRDEFYLHYQPQFDLLTGQLSGMEALLRWNNWELGIVPPIEFIPIAEECGLMVDIGEWVLRTACQQAKTWLDQGLLLPRIAINVSIQQLIHSDFIELVKSVLANTGLEPRMLELEITESLLMKEPLVIADSLHALKELNIQVAIDDFGTGYSNLGRLKELPIDCLKIDRSFITGIDTGIKDESILKAVIAIGSNMDLRVIAEGVETLHQVNFLRNKQCQEGQGFLFSRPLSRENAEEFLRQNPSSSSWFNGSVIPDSRVSTCQTTE